MTARERFKAMLSDAHERLCILEEQLEETQVRLEQAQARIAELEAERVTMPPSPSAGTFVGLAHR